MLAPLSFVVFVSMLKDAFEDYKRHENDKSENYSQSEVYNRKKQKYESQHWKDIHCGDIIRVQENEFIPADLMILATSDQDTCYIETKNLDGETNLKIKQAIGRTYSIRSGEYEESGQFQGDDPDPDGDCYPFSRDLQFRLESEVRFLHLYDL